MYEMDFFKYNYKDSLLPQNEVYPVRDVLSQRLNFDNLLERKHFTRIQIPCFFFLVAIYSRAHTEWVFLCFSVPCSCCPGVVLGGETWGIKGN